MRTATFSTDTLTALLRQRTVAPLPDIMAAFGSASRRTVCRKLVAAGCRSSYSHCGRYFTLDELAAYDQHGLWFHGEIRFAVAGTLLATGEALVDKAPAGRFASELRRLVQVDVQDALRKLVRSRRLEREKLAGRFLYLSRTSRRRRRQLRARWVMLAGGGGGSELDGGSEQIRRATGTLVSLLDERQRRLYAGLESLRHGRGGDVRTAARLGMSPATVAKRRKQLLRGDFETDRVRKPGGGRKPLVKKPCADRAARGTAPPRHGGRPLFRSALDPAHDPQPRRPSHRTRPASLRALCRAAAARHGLLPAGQFQCLPSTSPTERNAQFEFIARLRRDCARRNIPIVSIDSKKKEWVGRFRNPGAAWEPAPVAVNDHDFRSHADGLAVPHGIYDTLANRGFVRVGVSSDTPFFAVDNLDAWWRTAGCDRYPEASSLVILADCGGSNGYRTRAWKYCLQHHFCSVHRIAVTVAHYPAGCSK